MKRQGTISDWRELHRVIDAMVRGHISFSRFAELGKLWLHGAGSEDLAGMLPMSETERIVRYLKDVGGVANARVVDRALGFPAERTAQLCGRLRERGLVKTVREGNQIALHLLDGKRGRDNSGGRGKR